MSISLLTQLKKRAEGFDPSALMAASADELNGAKLL